jgi:hypothetical protein
MPVNIIDTLKPKNNGSFPVVEAADVSVSEELRLPEALAAKADVSDLATTNSTVATKADASALATATAELQGEINQIVISASSEAVVAPEVAAARVDAAGTEYTTLKGRLDGHDSKATATQNELRADFDVIENTYVNKDTGEETSLSLYFVTDFIPISFDVAVKTYVSDDSSGICFYDGSKSFISGYNPYSDNGTEVILSPPTNARYVRVTCRDEHRQSFICRYNNALPTISSNLINLDNLIEQENDSISNLENNIYGGIAVYPVDYTEGYYVNNVQRTLSPFEDFNTSDLIELKQGETIVVSGARSNTTVVVDLLSRWTANGTYVESIEAYSNTSTVSAEYTATNEVEYVRVCSVPIPTVSKTVEGIAEDIKGITNGLDSAVDDIDEIKQNAITYIEIEPELEEVTGKYINMNGSIMSLGIYAYTKSIEIHRGDTVSIRSQDPSGSAVSRISLWTATGKYIRTVDYGTTAVTTGTYTATESVEYVRFSYCTRNSVVIKEITMNVPSGFSDAVNNIIDERFEPVVDTDIYYSVAMFESVAFCGDSYVKGQIYNSQGLVGDRPDLAWGSCIGRLFGVDAHIYASSGADTNTWQERSDCLPRALSENARGLYIFCMGINDSVYVDTGSIEDITSYESYEDYPDTFYGNYGKIIEQIMEHAPSSKIIIMTPYHPSYNTQYVTPVQEITEHYGIAMINTKNSDLCMDARFTSLLVGGHPTAPLHSAMANDIGMLIRKCIQDNYSYFKTYSGV